MAFGFICDICGSQIAMPKHITGLKTGLLTSCPDCHKDLLRYAKHLKEKKQAK